MTALGCRAIQGLAFSDIVIRVGRASQVLVHDTGTRIVGV